MHRSLAEAPRYPETQNGRVALISVSSSFDPYMMAGEQSPRVPERPGINGLRLEKHIELPTDEFELIKRIAKQTNINAVKDISLEVVSLLCYNDSICKMSI